MGVYSVNTEKIKEYQQDFNQIIVSERRKKDELFGATSFLNDARWCEYVDSALYSEVKTSLDGLIQRSEALSSGLTAYILECEENERKNLERYGNNNPGNPQYGYQDIHFSMGNGQGSFNPEYLEYTAYGFTMCGYSIQEYNVNSYISAFRESFGAGVLQTANIADWARYLRAICGDSDAYANELMRAALKSVLDEMPMPNGVSLEQMESDPMDLNIDKFFSNAKKYTGDWSKIYEWVMGVADGRIKEEFNGTPFERELVDQIIAMDKNGRYIIKFLSEASKYCEAAGKGLEITDNLIYALNHWCADYSQQLSYLDSMEDAFNAMGYTADNARYVISQIRNQYEDLSYDLLIKNMGKIEKVISGSAMEVVNLIPGVKQVTGTLGIVGDVAAIVGGDSIKAADALYGLNMYDQALCNRFSVFQGKMLDGTITGEEMKEANSLFEVIKATKIKEYENLITLKEKNFNVGNVSLTQLKEQLEELQGMNASSFAETMRVSYSGGGASSGGSRF